MVDPEARHRPLRGRPSGLVLAAGAGRRFGGTKQLAELDGRPLLEHVLAAMAAAPLERVVVVLGADAIRVRDAIDLHGAEAVHCSNWEEGQSASLRTGLQALREAPAAIVAPGDGPRLAPESVCRVITAWRGGALAARATYDGRPGHPVLLDRTLFPPLLSARGDVGARPLLARIDVAELPCGDLGDPADVDTPADLQRLRSPDPGDDRARVS